MTPEPQSDRSVAELFGELASDTATLVRQEVKLATTEITQKVSYVGWQSLNVLIGALVAVVGITWLFGAAFFGLSTVLPMWASALCLGGFASLIALTFILKGVFALKRVDVTPHQTMQTLEENKTWAHKQIQ